MRELGLGRRGGRGVGEAVGRRGEAASTLFPEVILRLSGGLSVSLFICLFTCMLAIAQR